MNLGPLAVPAGPLAFFVGIGVSLLASKLSGAKQSEVDRALFVALLTGLFVARVVFVLQYFSSYRGDFLQMLDVGDRGFAPIPGMTAAIVVVVVTAIRRSALRRSLVIAVTSGLVAWGVADAIAANSDGPSRVPSISLADEAGVPHRLELNNGRPLVVNLWATWCGPCRGEMPVLADAQTRHPGLDLVFVNQGEDRQTVDTFLADLNLHLANSRFDPQLTLAKNTNVSAYPTTLFYGTDGRLLEKHLGRVSQATFEAMISRLYPSLETSGH